MLTGECELLDRTFRRRAFSSWMKRLANLKGSSSDAHPNADPSIKRTGGHYSLKSKKYGAGKNNPYPASGSFNACNKPDADGILPFAASPRTASMPTFEPSRYSPHTAVPSRLPVPSGRRSATTTVSTELDTTQSDTANSGKATSSAADTNNTVGGAVSFHGGAGSTFSSPAPSVRSLTTTLTTVQSTGPAHLLPLSTQSQSVTSNSTVIPSHSPNINGTVNQTTVFSHQFPTSPPPSAIPSHMAAHLNSGSPTTYTAATANNLLTDNASILTLASSSKRQRRHSLDTNASVRALAPSSLWGGSRESLPLSVLSANIGDPNNPSTPGIQHGRPSVGGIAGGERASVYSVSGVGPALSSERNSLYAGKQAISADAASVKSGLLGHGRNDSITGSIGGASLLVASPKELNFSGTGPGRVSRRNSEWAEVSEEIDDGEENERAEKSLVR